MIYTFSHYTTLFLKPLQGDPAAPLCGFSNMACQILNAYGTLNRHIASSLQPMPQHSQLSMPPKALQHKTALLVNHSACYYLSSFQILSSACTFDAVE
jgi:hypothetical protein